MRGGSGRTSITCWNCVGENMKKCLNMAGVTPRSAPYSGAERQMSPQNWAHAGTSVVFELAVLHVAVGVAIVLSRKGSNGSLDSINPLQKNETL